MVLLALQSWAFSLSCTFHMSIVRSCRGTLINPNFCRQLSKQRIMERGWGALAVSLTAVSYSALLSLSFSFFFLTKKAISSILKCLLWSRWENVPELTSRCLKIKSDSTDIWYYVSSNQPSFCSTAGAQKRLPPPHWIFWNIWAKPFVMIHVANIRSVNKVIWSKEQSGQKLISPSAF